MPVSQSPDPVMAASLRRHHIAGVVLTIPSLAWLVLLFALPMLLVLLISFRPPTVGGGIGEGWSLGSWAALAHPAYPWILWRTVWLSLATTVICLGLALPMSYYLARLPLHTRNWLLLLLILPFWTNFLIRVFAWRTLLHPEGFLKTALQWSGLVSPETILLYNNGAILLVLVYTYLPFAILPLFAAAERFDFGLLDAARDLGAGRCRAWFSVFLPGVSRGLLTATLVVFIPALGSYAIPDLVGGPSNEMLGNRIAQRVFTERNLPHAATLSSVLTLSVLLPVVYLLFRRRSGPSIKGTV